MANGRGCQNGLFMANGRGCQNGLFMANGHFSWVTGSEEQNPLFFWVECNIRIFADCCQNHPLFRQGTKTPFSNTTVSTTPKNGDDALSGGGGIWERSFSNGREVCTKSRDGPANARPKCFHHSASREAAQKIAGSTSTDNGEGRSRGCC